MCGTRRIPAFPIFLSGLPHSAGQSTRRLPDNPIIGAGLRSRIGQGFGLRIPIDVAQDSEMISPTIPI
jgi:hypothetical protein